MKKELLKINLLSYRSFLRWVKANTEYAIVIPRKYVILTSKNGGIKIPADNAEIYNHIKHRELTNEN
jgi:hypothetical protein